MSRNKLEESLLFIIVFRQPYCIWINEDGTSILELEAKFNYEIDEKNFPQYTNWNVKNGFIKKYVLKPLFFFIPQL